MSESNGNGAMSQILVTVIAAAVIGLVTGYIVLRTDVAVLQADVSAVKSTINDIRQLVQSEFAAHHHSAPKGAPARGVAHEP